MRDVKYDKTGMPLARFHVGDVVIGTETGAYHQEVGRVYYVHPNLAPVGVFWRGIGKALMHPRNLAFTQTVKVGRG